MGRPTVPGEHPNLDAAVDALPPLTDEECAALGDLLLAIRIGAAR